MLIVFRRIFIVSIVLYCNLFATSNYDDDILSIYAKIMPRLVLMSNQVSDLKNQINICVVSEDIDKLNAKKLIQKSNENYPHGIKNYKLNFLYTDYLHISKCKNSKLAFLFNSSDENIDNFLKFSMKKKILTISYDKEFLQNGVDMSLFLGRKITPYLNMNSITKKGIILNSILLRISKIYSQKDD